MSRVPAEAQKIAENTAIMRNVFGILRDNTKEAVVLYARVPFIYSAALINISIDHQAT